MRNSESKIEMSFQTEDFHFNEGAWLLQWAWNLVSFSALQVELKSIDRELANIFSMKFTAINQQHELTKGVLL